MFSLRIWSVLLLASLFLVSCLSTSTPPSKTVEPVSIFLDTDLGIDIDDAGALAVLHTLADRGEANILATVSNVYDPHAPAALDAINTYYGRPDIPIGRNPNPEHYPVATPYWRDDIPEPHFIEPMADFPNDTDRASLTPATEIYRQTLAAQPDNSVTVVSLGFMQNMADLMNSAPDQYSDLRGMELIQQKVKKLVLMGGFYPGHPGELYLSGGKEMDAAAANQVIDSWPTPMVFSPGNKDVCDGVVNGTTISEATPPTNPVRRGYELFAEQRGRTAWDLCAVLYAVRGNSDPEDGAYFKLAETEERLAVESDGASSWVPDASSRHSRMLRVMPEEELERVLEALLVAPPQR